MSQKTFSTLLKIVIVGAALCIAFVYAWVIPELGVPLAEAGDGEFAHLYTPWLVAIELTALPIAAALVLAWLIAVNIGHDKSFCVQNARLLAAISVLAIADAAYFFVAVTALTLIYKVMHPGVAIFTLMVCFAGVAIGVAAAALSHYARKGAELQEQSDLTI